MLYNHNLLNKKEQAALFTLILHYKNYDKLDILIERVIRDPIEFSKRKNLKKKKEKEVINQIPEGIKYCDGDKCNY